jgi:uncharacterized protein with PQ loop repeat
MQTIGIVGELAGAVAVVTTVLRSWPQAWKVTRSTDVSGVSVLTWALAASCHMSWVTYGVMRGLVATWLANGAAGVGCLLVLGTLRIRHRRRLGRVVLTAVGGTLLAVTAMRVLTGVAGVGLVALLLALAMFVPQTYATMKGGTSGVSSVAWLFIFLSTVAWAAYGVAESDAFVALPTVVIGPCAAVVLVRSLSHSRNAGYP